MTLSRRNSHFVVLQEPLGEMRHHKRVHKRVHSLNRPDSREFLSLRVVAEETALMPQHNKYLRRTYFGVYTFRLRVPQELVPILGKKEICKSLATRDLKSAEELSRTCEADAKRLFQQLRRKYLMTTEDEFDYLIKSAGEYSKNKIEVGRIHAAADGSVTVEGVKYDPNKSYEEERAALRGMVEDVKGFVAVPVVTTAAQTVVPTTVVTEKVVEAPQREKFCLFSNLCERFCSHQVSKKKWKRDSNRKNHMSVFGLFEEFYGNKPVHLYTRDESEDFLDRLQKMPHRWKTTAAIQGLPYEKAIKLGYSTIEPRSVAIYLVRIRSLFKYAITARYSDWNIFDGVTIEVDEKNGAPYTKPEIQMLFDDRNFMSFQRLDAPSRYWAPLLAAWTGMRLAEIFQLTTEDIYNYYQIPVIDINDKSGKTVKNKNAVRIIPIHSDLVSFGFLDYVAKRRKDRKSKCIFPEYPLQGEDSGRSFSTLFGRYRDTLRNSLGKNENNLFQKGKNMHAFRHLFIKEQRRCKLDPQVERQLCGHSTAKDTHDKYGIDPMKSDAEIKEIVETLNNAIQVLQISAYFPKVKTYAEVKKLSLQPKHGNQH